MLLIIFLGLFAKIASVYGDCEVGPLQLNDFNWTEFSAPGIWYVRFHPSNDVDNYLACFEITIEPPVENKSLITFNLYDKREKHHMIHQGNLTNWKSSGYFETYSPVPIWNGPFYVLAVDPDRYVIVQHCTFNSSEAVTYVAFRKSRPGLVTVMKVLKKLREYNIDYSHLEITSTDQYEELECKRKRKVPHINNGLRN